MFKQIMMLLDKAADDKGAAGGTGSASETPPATPPADAAGVTAPQATGDERDAFGYKIIKADEPPKEGEKTGKEKDPPAPPPKEEKLEDIKDPASGYGVKPPEIPKEDDPPAGDPPEPPKDAEIDVKGLADAEVAKVKEFAKANGLSKEQAQKFADLKKSEALVASQAQAAAQKKNQIEVAKLKASWHEELKSDKDFGGEAGVNFDKSLLKVEKVLKDFLPGTKKQLTEGGITLHPTVMKDLAKLADKLYGSEKFEQGSAGQAPDGDAGEKEHQPWDVYKHNEK